MCLIKPKHDNSIKEKRTKMNIVVLAGGLSTERDVSFKTGSMVAKALKEKSTTKLYYWMYLWDIVTGRRT